MCCKLVKKLFLSILNLETQEVGNWYFEIMGVLVLIYELIESLEKNTNPMESLQHSESKTFRFI